MNRYQVIDWNASPFCAFSTSNIHEAREMLANANSLGFNPASTFIWDTQKKEQADRGWREREKP